MPAIFFAIISYFGWGVGDVFGTAATRKIGPYSATFWFLIIQGLIFSVFTFSFFPNLANYSPAILLFNIILGVIATAGLVAFYEGLRIGSASLVGTVSSSFVAPVVILSIIFFKEAISQQQALAIVIIFFGLIFSSLDFDELKKRNFRVGKEIILSVVAMVCWAIFWTFIKIPIREVGWFWPGYISTISSIPAMYIYIKLKKFKITGINHKKAFLPIFFNAALLGGGSLSFNYALQKGLAAVVAPIAGSYPTLFAVLAYLAFRDKITKLQIAGISVTLLGIIILSVAST